MKRKNILYFAVFFLILSGLTFFYERYRIPNIVDKTYDVKKEAVIYTVDTIPRNTFITEEIINKNLRTVEVPSEYVFHESILPDEIIGKKALVDIPSGAYLSREFFIDETMGYKDGEQDYSIPITTSNAVSGKVRPNDYVTVWVRYPNRSSGEVAGRYDSEVVEPYIKVEDLTDEGGNSILSEGTTIQYAVIKANRDLIQDLEIARKYELYLTKYGENEDFVPTKTFDRTEHIYTSKPFDNYTEKEDYLRYLDSLFPVPKNGDVDANEKSIENEEVKDTENTETKEVDGTDDSNAVGNETENVKKDVINSDGE
ncbi:hypothetical protein NE686_17275 [Tissierella carlieri]|uniref:Flp pilus assembly protein CpaB n=1 Tax=Tissierella carlieri TaxID=689904 RepID=A0ABT1SG17_9FIRM|nr:hypothetical protein [Tissierella carlieri]MCQ4924857.1 hypothetical protein [Tissierella carlieri]